MAVYIHEMKDEERGGDGYRKDWSTAEFLIGTKLKTCSLFRGACAMEMQTSIIKKKKIIPVMESDERHYGFVDVFPPVREGTTLLEKQLYLSNNVPNQFITAIFDEDVI